MILLALGLGASSPVLSFEVTGLGTVSASTFEPIGDDGGPARLVFRGPAREVIGDFTFDVGRGSHTSLSLTTIDAEGMPTPLVIAVADMMGADGVRIQAALFAVQGRQVRPLLPAVFDLEAEDGMCAGALGPGLPLGAAAIRSLSGEGTRIGS